MKKRQKAFCRKLISYKTADKVAMPGKSGARSLYQEYMSARLMCVQRVTFREYRD